MSACVKCGHDPSVAVRTLWTFTLDKRLTSANLRTVNVGASRWRYAKERDDWQMLVRVAAANSGNRAWLAAPTGIKRRVTITRHHAGRCKEIDRDNLVAGVKPLVDAFVRAGLLRDDDSAHLELHVLQMRTQRNVTHVLVEEFA